jgi:ribonuclease HI
MKKIIINTDGASRGNPGKASIGVVFYNEKEQIIKEFGEYLGDKLTNNEAEYQAVIYALKKFKTVFGKEIAKTTELEIRSDSELMVSQLNGKYKLVNENIQKFFIEIWNLKTDFISVKFKQIPREKNKDADRMANQALDSQPQTLI